MRPGFATGEVGITFALALPVAAADWPLWHSPNGGGRTSTAFTHLSLVSFVSTEMFWYGMVPFPFHRDGEQTGCVA